MNPEKIIKKYIMPGALVPVGAIVLGLALVVCLVMGITTQGAEMPDPVEFYPDDTPAGTMAYIDVVGVSNWLYQYDSAIYYSVEDAEGYLYTVRLEDSQLAEMSAQADYWNRTTEDAPMPEPHRLVGYVQKTADNVRESLAQSWDITVGEYDQYFGANFLNATTSTGVENSVPWFIGALFSGLFALLCLVFQLRAASVSRKCLKVLEERCLVEKAAQQLENSEEHFVVGKNRGILTRDFIFGKGTGAVIAYTDVIWAYKMDRRSYMVENAYLMAGTPWMGVENVIDLNKPDKYGHVSDALAMISRKNPETLLGYTSENRKAYKATLKAGK